MREVFWIVIGLFILGLLYSIFYFTKNKGLPTNYRAMFIVGIASIPLGISTENYAFMAIGIVFMVLGLKNKNKWKESSIEWSELSSKDKNVRIALISAGIIILLAVLLVYLKSAG